MVCDICGKSGARQRYISRSYGEGESLLVEVLSPDATAYRCRKRRCYLPHRRSFLFSVFFQ